MMESDVERLIDEKPLVKLAFSIPWIIGPLIYAVGLLLSAATGNLARFVADYPWACLVTVITATLWAIPRFTERHGRYTIAVRSALDISDKEFKSLFEGNMRRLMGWRNMVFGLVFLPGLLWAYTQRLWWGEYSQPLFFDAYYLVVLTFVLLNYGTMMFGAAVSCNQNVYDMCEATPLNAEYLLDEGRSIFQKQWGGQILRITIFALAMSALANVPILLYSGSSSILLNLTIALALTTLIFVAPHYMFHRMLERAKEEVLANVSGRRRELGLQKRGITESGEVGRMLDIIYLTQYEAALASRSTWLVNLEVVAELLVVGSLHVTFMEVLNILAHR